MLFRSGRFKCNLNSQRIDEGLSEQEAWRLFQQILEALVYMSSLGIVRLLSLALVET